jgi:subtilisin-like proprotein convertase family protein
MYKLSFILFALLLSFNLSSQIWSPVSSDKVENKGSRDIVPSAFRLYAIDDADMKLNLFKAPHETDVIDALNSKTTIQVPAADGTMYTFAVVSYHLLHPDLQKSFPDIRAFYGVSIEDQTVTIIADYSPLYGFRAVINQPGIGKTYIDHYQRNDLKHRIAYYRKNYSKNSNWKCGVINDQRKREGETSGSRAVQFGDCSFREYRLALSCTGEYAAFHGGTIPNALAAMNTTMNRVNGVFAQEVAIRCVIIANNTSIMYTNAGTDPFTNGDPGLMINENQTNTDLVITSANYDVGHVFGTNSGGLAGLGVFCSNGNKARGVTGSGAPIGDAFDIDYVAHEMGHQLSGNHSFNNSCDGNRNASTAMEPGSGSSIMAYAGICPPNVQNNSDENFHAISLQEMKSFLAAGGSNCDIPVAGYSNSPPNISAPSNNTTYTIPRSTPFALTMTATDPNGNGILYGWDQMNNNIATMPPPATNTVGPAFRFLEPTTNPTRYFPNLTAVLAGALVGFPFGGNNWEVIPSVARTMNFTGVARDITPMSASCNSEVNVIVNTVAAAGPFAITSQNAATTWPQASSQTVTWDVSGTTANGVNCQQVDLLWTTNSGSSFTTLLAGVANDGSQNVVVPSSNTTTGRVMVRAVGNVFFDINNANITINTTGSTPTFNLGLSSYYNTICQGTSQVYTINVLSYSGFTSPVTLSVSGLPSGITASFANSVVTPGTTTQLTLTNTNATVGTYTLALNGVSGAISKVMDFSVVSALATGNTTLSSPANNATNISTLPTLTWTAATNALTYQLQISRRPDFNSLVVNLSGLTSTTYTLISPLLGFSEYYWRVRPVNACGAGNWSSPSFKFDTESCMLYTSTNVPVNILDNATVTSNLLINDKGTITDLDIIDLEGTHTYVGDLRFNVISPANTNVRIWNQPCNSGQFLNFDINFNQSAAAGAPPCPPTNGLTYQPNGTGVGTLNSFNTQTVKGNWRLTAQDLVGGDQGILQNWRVRSCMTSFCRLTVDNDAHKGAGSLKAALDCAVDGDTIRFAPTFMNDTIMLFNENIVTSKRVYIEGDITKNIHLMSSSTNPTIVSSAPNTGFGLRIKGLHIHSSASTGIGAIQNTGLLTLENVYLYKSNLSTTTIQHNSGGINNISGDCRIRN